jgi:site-specific DNA-methyltransferase (cytosine-N4-specific)
MKSQKTHYIPINGIESEVFDKYEFVRHFSEMAYVTVKGIALLADSQSIISRIPDNTIDLIFTSPPFALRRKKRYGNEPAERYVDWFLQFAGDFRRVLKDTGSFVIDIGGSWNPGEPTKSLYHHKLLIALVEEAGFHLAQEVFWYNPARLPSPAQWVCIDRSRLKDAVNWVWWLSKTSRPKANNKRILTPYKPSQKALVDGGKYNTGRRPSEHVISDKFGIDNGGAIPSNMVTVDNLISASNTASSDPYLKGCKTLGIDPHPARIPAKIPEFFIKFLTEPGDIVLDPFGGSNVTGFIAEQNNRHWLTIEREPEYLYGSQTRFSDNYDSLKQNRDRLYDMMEIVNDCNSVK